MAPPDGEFLRHRVQHELLEFLDRQRTVLAELGPHVEPLEAMVRRLVAEGKRLRPAFCYWGWRGAGGHDCDEIVRAAAALELFQAAALIHDDLMDDSDTRRGMPAVHRAFSDLHIAGGWAGDPDDFGMAGAILAGDLCLGWSDEMLMTCGLDPRALSRGRSVFDLMRTQLMAGQYLDVLGQATGLLADGAEDEVAQALRVVRFKSGKYSVEHPLLLGAALAGASDEQMAAYSDLGLLLGEAFQLRDDVLGVFGDPQTTGKPAGDDLREGKRTVLVALTRRGTDETGRKLLDAHLGDRDLDDDGVNAVRNIIVTSGALDEVEHMIDERVRRVQDALRAAPITEPAHDALQDLVAAATVRVA